MDEPSAAPPAWDLTRIMLAVTTIGGLTALSFWILKPFLLAGIWAAMIVVATWPLLCAVQAQLWGRRSLAVGVMTLLMLLVIAAPLTTAVVAIVERTDDIVAWSRMLTRASIPGPPEWVSGLPLVGGFLAGEWEKLAATPSADLAARATPYLGDVGREVGRWLLSRVGNLGTLLVQLMLTVLISAILYARGEAAAAAVLAFSRRLAGEAGERVAVLSSRAVRAVALGIVVTALVQSVIGGLGLALAGVPYAVLLTSVMFLLGVAQIGPTPVLICAVVWVYWSSGTAWGTVLLVWALVTASLDNVLRPMLIRKGADLPFLLILAGVLGGLLAFGLVGLFVGPVVLSVTYTLLGAWVAEGEGRSRAAGQGMTGSPRA